MQDSNNLYENYNFYVIDNHPKYLANEYIENQGSLKNCYIKYSCKSGDGAAWRITETYTGNEMKGIIVVSDPKSIETKLDQSRQGYMQLSE